MTAGEDEQLIFRTVREFKLRNTSILAATFYNSFSLPQPSIVFVLRPLIFHFKYDKRRRSVFDRLRFQRISFGGNGKLGTTTLSRQLLCQMYTEWRLSWPQQELQMKLLHGNDYVCMGAYVIMVETAKNTFHSFPFALPILQSHLKSMVYTAEWPRRLKEHLTLIREYKNLKPLHLIRS